MSEKRLKSLLSTLVVAASVGVLFFYANDPVHPISVFVSYLCSIAVIVMFLYIAWLFAYMLIEMIMAMTHDIRSRVGMKKIVKFGEKAFLKEKKKEQE